MMFLLRHAWKELRAQPRFLALLLLNLGLGLSGFVAIDAFRFSVEASLAANARNSLGADIAVSVRRPWSAEERALAEKTLGIPEAEAVEMFSMVRAVGRSRLTMVKAVDPAFPLRGEIQLARGGKVGSGAAARLGVNRVWLHVDSASQLGAEIGGTVSLGGKSFVVDDFVTQDPGQTFRAFSGKVYVGRAGLDATGLLRPESVATYIMLWRLPEGKDPEQVRLEFSDPGVRLLTPQRASEDSGRLIQIVTDFLGLASLVGMFLSALGAGFLFQAWVVKRMKIWGLQQILGLSRTRALGVLVVQAVLVSVLSVPLTLSLSFLQLRLLRFLTHTISPVEFDAYLRPSAVVASGVLSLVVSLFLLIPELVALSRIPLRSVIHGNALGRRPIWAWFPAVAVLFLLAVWQSNSFRNAGIFVGAMVLALGLVAAVGWALQRVANQAAAHVRVFPLRHGLLHFARGGVASLAAFVALGLGVLLLNLLPQLRTAIQSELESPGKTPSLFLFDIQDEQLAGVTSIIEKAGARLSDLSPMVRARILRVNDQGYERSPGKNGFQTREEELDARFRNRGMNLSWRSELGAAEEIVKGAAFSKELQNPGEISLEKGFAERMGLRLGDQLVFDVQGVEIAGKVINLRRVKWSSFRPNFFVLFQDGVLNDAPKIYLASVGGVSESTKATLQDRISERFPNVSVIDIRLTVERIMELVDRIRWTLVLMAGVALLASFTVIFSITQIQSHLRRGQFNLLRVVGAGAPALRRMVVVEFGLLALVACFWGAVLSCGLAWALSRWVLEASYRPAWGVLSAAGGVIVVLAVVVALLGLGGVWRGSPARILQES